MILKRAIYYATIVVAFATAAVVCVVFLALALHAALAPMVGSAWASALVAGAAALLAAGAAGLTLMGGQPRRHKEQPQDLDVATRMIELAQAKPWVALGIVGAVAAVAFKNPRTTATVVSALMAGRATKK